MKKVLLLLTFISVAMVNAQKINKSNSNVKSDVLIDDVKVKFLPVNFIDVTVLILNFETKKDLSLLIKNLKGEVVYSRNIESVKNTSIKLDFSDFSKGEYKAILIDSNQIIFKESIFKL
jgi:hypothetical protein